MLKLISHIIAPIQLLPQGIKKTVIIKFDQFCHEFLPPDRKLNAGIHSRGSGIQRDQKLFAPPLYPETYDTVVRNNDGPYVQIVGANRSDDKVFGSGRNQGTTATQGITRGSGRR